MIEFDSPEAVLQSNAPQLAKILDSSGGEQACWLTEDLPDLLRHQWEAPIDFDLAQVGKEESKKTLARAAGANIRTFADLLLQERPSLPLLKLAKQFFKDKAGHSKKRDPEQQVGYLFYVLIILAARARLGTSITNLTDSDLEKAAKWAYSQPWIEGEPKELLRQLAPQL